MGRGGGFSVRLSLWGALSREGSGGLRSRPSGRGVGPRWITAAAGAGEAGGAVAALPGKDKAEVGRGGGCAASTSLPPRFSFGSSVSVLKKRKRLAYCM